MKRLLLISATAALAAVPASIGLWGNQSFAEEVPVSVPARATLVATSSPAKPTHEPTHAEPGDDHRGTTATHAEPSDDHRGTTATHAEPGDDHRGTTATHAEPGDDHRGTTATHA
ncbi:hypothetical protein, partial [Oryzihumus sp.]